MGSLPLGSLLSLVNADSVGDTILDFYNNLYTNNCNILMYGCVLYGVLNNNTFTEH